MLKEAIASGNTIDEAITAAKAELAAPEDIDIQIEVISLPQKKTFGLFGGSKAKVRAFYELEEKVEKIKEEEPKRPERPQTPKKKDKPLEAKKATEAKPLPKADKKPAIKEPVEQKEEVKEGAEVAPEQIADILTYLETILTALGLEKTQIDARTQDGELFIQIDSEEDYGILIGRRGETLDSVQYLVRLYANRGNRDYKRISLNVGNYREKRENNIKQLAGRTASKVLRYGRQTTLEPMNPYERRLIHTAVQDIKGVTSFSVGSESERRVVIALADGYRPQNKSNNRSFSKGSNYNRPNRNPGFKKENNMPKSDQGKKTVTQDAASVSLYGKIEPKK